MSSRDYIDSRDGYDDPFYFYKIRVPIFLIAAVCVGLPCLIWAFYSVHRLRKAKVGISTFIILLLISDLLQLILYPFIVTNVLTHHHFPSTLFFIIFATICLKICSLYLHQLVALEGVLTVKYPTISAHMFSSPCYIMISIIIILSPVFMIVSTVVSRCEPIQYLALGTILPCVCLLVVTGIIVYKAPPTAATTPVNHRPGAKVFTVSLVTLLLVSLPYVLFYFVSMRDYTYMRNNIRHSCAVIAFCLLSLTVIPEPLLCVLVCRENLSVQGKHTQIEINAEETAV